MAKPSIVTVDDDPQVLNAVERDLRARYAADYRIVGATSGTEALEAVLALKTRGDEVALFLADQRMPTMTGTEFLLKAAPSFPNARTVLLAADADTDAAIQAINDVGLDHYLLKPWSPPEDRLYPVRDELLEDWQANTDAPYDGIRVLGTTWSPTTHETKDFLARNQIPYRFLDIERDPDAAAIVAAGGGDLPVVLLPNGSSLVRPDRRTLASSVGMQTEAASTFYDLIVVGAGPAGLAAGVYGASEGLRTAVIERDATGGQAGMSSRIENYLGFPKGISGADLARRAATQAQRLGAEIITAGDVTGIRVEDPIKLVTLADGKELACRAIVLATGMTTRTLDVPGYEKFAGAGVYYGAAIAEAATYRDQPVFIVGGANSAGQAAMMFSRFSSQVTMIVRGTNLEDKMSQYLVDQIHRTPNIEAVLSAGVVEVRGERRMETIVLDRAGTIEERPAAALFIFVGAVPHTAMAKGVVALNPQGFIVTGADIPAGLWPLARDPFLMETSIPGIFAAGDVRHGVVRRVASAVGQGSVCVSFVHEYLATV